jgi:hypothetical protein
MYFSLTALTSLAGDRSTPPAGEGRSLLAASLRAGDLEALAGGLAKAMRDYVRSSLEARQSGSLPDIIIRLLKLTLWLLAQPPGVGNDAARAMPPGVALDLAALAMGGREEDPEDVSGGRCGLGRAETPGACVESPCGWLA